MRHRFSKIRKNSTPVVGLIVAIALVAQCFGQSSYPTTGAPAITARPTTPQPVAPRPLLTIAPATGPVVNASNHPTPYHAPANTPAVLGPELVAPQASVVRAAPSRHAYPSTNSPNAIRAHHLSDPLQPTGTATLTAGEERKPVIRLASPIHINLHDAKTGPQSISEATKSVYPSTAAPDFSIITPTVPTTPIVPQPAPSPLPSFDAAPLTENESPGLLSAAPMFPPNSKPTDNLIPVESATNQGLPLLSLPPKPATPPGPLYLAAPQPNDVQTNRSASLPLATTSPAPDAVPPTTTPPTSTPTATPPTSTPTGTPPTGHGNVAMEYGGYGQFGDGCGNVYEPHDFFDSNAFCPDPSYDHIPYNSVAELGIYEGKWNMCSQRPLIELGRGRYRNGVVPKSYSFLGKKNLITPAFTLFGDFRTAVAVNDNGAGDPKAIWANRLNLDFNLRITATERIHAFWGPIDEDGRFTRVESFTDGRNDLKFFEEFDDDFDTLFFEGDLGYMYGGMTDQWAPFDLPFVAGKFPLLFQNGVWINDAVEGFAFTIPAKNSRHLNWSNFDLTMFFLFDDIDSAAFLGDDNAADAYGFNLFLEAYGGYTEAGYAFLDDRTGLGRSYHNMTVGFTRRYRQRLSNSVRVIVNSGQDPNDGVKTADGQLLIIENSLVSSNPTYFVPYANFFAGFGTPKNLAGQAVLQNVGINFETDALTGFPKLNDQAQDTWGGAFGFNLLGPRFSWQWILEASMVQDFGDSLNGDEYAVGTRIQRSLNYAWLARIDAMYGLRENAADISGVRAELRWKF